MPNEIEVIYFIGNCFWAMKLLGRNLNEKFIFQGLPTWYFLGEDIKRPFQILRELSFNAGYSLKVHQKALS